MSRPIKYAAIVGCLAVLLGAFGAHGLEGRISEKALQVWSTANRYHFLHALAILALEIGTCWGLSRTRPALALWSVGLLLFSGSLYVYAFAGLKLAAMVAPIGGLSYAAGWLSLLMVQVDNDR